MGLGGQATNSTGQAGCGNPPRCPRRCRNRTAYWPGHRISPGAVPPGSAGRGIPGPCRPSDRNSSNSGWQPPRRVGRPAETRHRRSRARTSRRTGGRRSLALVPQLLAAPTPGTGRPDSRVRRRARRHVGHGQHVTTGRVLTMRSPTRCRRSAPRPVRLVNHQCDAPCSPVHHGLTGTARYRRRSARRPPRGFPLAQDHNSSPWTSIRKRSSG